MLIHFKCFHLCIERSQMKTLVHHPEIYILVLEKRICFFKDVLIFFVVVVVVIVVAISWVTPAAYGGSQARGLIGAVATGLHQSHSNAGSEPRLQPTPQLTATPDC